MKTNLHKHYTQREKEKNFLIDDNNIVDGKNTKILIFKKSLKSPKIKLVENNLKIDIPYILITPNEVKIDIDIDITKSYHIQISDGLKKGT